MILTPFGPFGPFDTFGPCDTLRAGRLRASKLSAGGRPVAVGSWDPGSDVRPDAELLTRLAGIARRTPEDPADGLSEDEIRGLAPIMRLAASDWAPLLATVDDALLVDLVRFFTVAEMKLAGWEGGDRSPVIAMVKVLRARKHYPPELTRWIKDRTDNRYLPYGSLLDRL